MDESKQQDEITGLEEEGKTEERKEDGLEEDSKTVRGVIFMPNDFRNEKLKSTNYSSLFSKLLS